MEYKSTILIVDDEPMNHDIFKALMYKEGYDLISAANGLEAIEKAREYMPDVILLDVMMPEMDGFEACRRLRADDLLAEVPIVMVTTLDDKESRLTGIEAGADDFLTKPYDKDELRARVRTIVRLNRYRGLLERTLELDKINKELCREIEERKRVQEELQNYQKNLEITITERTRELENAQKELLSKALEAGRAEMSAVILHNIGNAITPVITQTETLKTDKSAEIIGYMRKCYDDLKNHSDDLQYYVSEDPRGKQIFSYMGDVIDSLTEQGQTQSDIVYKIDKAISYISEILNIQQTHMVSRQELREQTDLNRLIEDAIHMQAGTLEKSRIVVKKYLLPDIPKLLIDKNRLMQVIVNFIKNSYEAIDEFENEKIISVRTFANNEQVGFEITDTGIGIGPDQIHKIFEFGRSHKGSSGVGLHYCRMFAEANRGTLDISSPGRGKGATVSVAFEIGM
ncbi:response regulator [Desulfococcaceae bacterium HSG8]|nr:response regulator [Desulfococcaceae bacterium HSG8]